MLVSSIINESFLSTMTAIYVITTTTDTNTDTAVITTIAAAIDITVMYWQPGGDSRYRAKWRIV